MHLYIHIPFCKSKCHYCAFTSLDIKGFEKSYFDALLYDIKYHINKFKISNINTLYIGGGTPSLIDAILYKELFSFLRPLFDPNIEISIEANPNSGDKAWLKEIKNIGINRISFGIQSFDEKKLRFLGRIHNSDDIYTSIKNAINVGFENINIDIIYDTKLDDKKMLEFELDNIYKAHKMGINHISAYNLNIEKNTKFYKYPNYKKNAPFLMKFFINEIQKIGFEQYEISNFGNICKHNLAYWLGKDYLGCGLSSVSFHKNTRFYTHKNIKNYILDPIFRYEEYLNEDELFLEHLFMGLRSIIGVDINKLNAKQLEKIKILSKNKKIIINNNKIFNTNYLISDELALWISS